MKLSDLTIIIPTINRTSMLERTLGYYANSGITSKIILADSSNEELKSKNKELVLNYSKKLEIEYFHIPEESSLMTKMSIAADKVLTPYVIEVGDDDFLLKSSLLKVMNELEKDQTLAAGYGHRLGIRAMSKPTEGIKWIDVFPFYDMSIEDEKPWDRIRKLPVPSWQQYPYAIYRREVLKASCRTVKSCKAAQYVEFFKFAAVLAQGKWKKFDCLFTVCNTDSDYYRLRSKGSFPIYWGYKGKGNITTQMSNPIWSEYVSILSHNVAEILSNCESEQGDIAAKLTRTYWAINNKYLEQNGLISNYLFHDDQLIARRINKVLSKFNKFTLAFLLPDRNGGVNAWYRMAFALLKEILNGRIVANYMNRSVNNNFRSLFAHLKRTESLDYELTNLLDTSSEYYHEFSKIFEIWVDNPCPKIHTDEYL